MEGIVPSSVRTGRRQAVTVIPEERTNFAPFPPSAGTLRTNKVLHSRTKDGLYFEAGFPRSVYLGAQETSDVKTCMLESAGIPPLDVPLFSLQEPVSAASVRRSSTPSL